MLLRRASRFSSSLLKAPPPSLKVRKRDASRSPLAPKEIARRQSSPRRGPACFDAVAARARLPAPRASLRRRRRRGSTSWCRSQRAPRPTRDMYAAVSHSFVVRRRSLRTAPRRAQPHLVPRRAERLAREAARLAAEHDRGRDVLQGMGERRARAHVYAVCPLAARRRLLEVRHTRNNQEPRAAGLACETARIRSIAGTTRSSASSCSLSEFATAFVRVRLFHRSIVMLYCCLGSSSSSRSRWWWVSRLFFFGSVAALAVGGRRWWRRDRWRALSLCPLVLPTAENATTSNLEIPTTTTRRSN